jgi:hypothetical protein
LSEDFSQKHRIMCRNGTKIPLTAIPDGNCALTTVTGGEVSCFLWYKLCTLCIQTWCGDLWCHFLWKHFPQPYNSFIFHLQKGKLREGSFYIHFRQCSYYSWCKYLSVAFLYHISFDLSLSEMWHKSFFSHGPSISLFEKVTIQIIAFILS